jgi:hypothetical protein
LVPHLPAPPVQPISGPETALINATSRDVG